MKDQQLFEMIKTVIQQKKVIPKHEETLTFAERYCKQQMLKKKLVPYNPNQKMSHLMKNFTKLQTYVDLPELLSAIQIMKDSHPSEKAKHAYLSDQISQPGYSKAKLQNPTDKNEKLKNYFNDKRKLLYILDNENVKKMMKVIQKSTNLTSQVLKNNSHTSTINLLDMINEDSSDFSIENNNKIFEMLSKFKENQTNFEFHEDEERLEYKETCLNSSAKKNQSKFLHKVTSYLQIILESQHKSKWENTKKFKSAHVSHQNSPKLLKSAVKYKPKKDQKIKLTLTSPKFSDLDSSLARQTRIDQELSNVPIDSTDKENITSCKSTSGYAKTHKFTEGSKRSANQTLKAFGKNNTFYQNRKIKKQAAKSLVKDAFTFRKRTIKQKIVNRLNEFIAEIDDQNYSSKKENEYYFNEINKLQKNYHKMYSKYRRETLVGDKDIQNLTKLANAFQLSQFRKQSQAAYAEGEEYDNVEVLGRRSLGLEDD